MLVTPNADPVAKIKVIGVGGGGGNAINTMISNYEFDGVEFMAFNTDAQALKNSFAPITLQLGSELTRGLGVGGDHVRGARLQKKVLMKFMSILAGADLCYL
jgi:cell division protein FtsZ